MSSVAVVHYVGATQRSRSVVASLLADLVDAGDKVTLIDIGSFTTISQDFPPTPLVKLLGHRVHHQAFPDALTNMGVSYHRLKAHPTHLHRPSPRQWLVCQEAIESELLTYFRRESLVPETAAIASLRSALSRQTLACFDALSRALESLDPERVLIPNGRTSRQKAARLACEERNIDVRFYENGRAKSNSYYAGKTQPHDRLASQAEVGTLLEGHTTESIIAMASLWLQERMNPGSETNTFSTAWKNLKDISSPLKTQNAQPVAVFFTSSADEFKAFGPMWKTDSWVGQFEAFDLIMGLLQEKDCALVLRVHPNLSGKSRAYFLKTLENIRALQRNHPRLVVHWHNSPINSYDLVLNADYVIAERSTIGVEANLMGKPVWINQASQWDLVADVRQVLTQSDITAENFVPWQVDPLGAQRFVAYWVLQEKPLRFTWKDWSTWNPERPPLRMQIASLATKNSWRHRLHLVQLHWDGVRNARFSARGDKGKPIV